MGDAATIDGAATRGSATAYTDGSCIGNPGPGGWAVHAEFADGRVLELGGGELDTTNNRMELRAAIEALRATSDSPTATVITDSAYVQNGITKWVAGWKRNGWRTATGQPVENRGLWTELDALARPEVRWQWTRAHVGTPGNERVDAIARWFALSIGRLGPDGSPTASPGPGARSRGAPPAGVRYVSLVDGIVARHATWQDCEQRVRGVRDARYRKVRSDDEERTVLEGWGAPEPWFVE